MQVDYFIIGQGLAGSVLAHTLHQQGCSFIIIDADHPVTSSKVAAGLINPVTGKRVVKTWLADCIFPFAASFYTALEKQLDARFYHSKKIYKPYQSIEEQNDVIAKTAEDRLSPYISIDCANETFQPFIHNELGGIEIAHSGYLDTNSFLTASRTFFTSIQSFEKGTVAFSDFAVTDKCVTWKNHSAKKIIFSEGFAAINNPLFNWLPFSVTKGQILELEIANFQKDYIINKGAFVLPKKDGKYLAGSSYEHATDNTVTEKGQKMVEDKLKTMLKVPYKIVGQRAAVRPTVRDRRPFLGIHPEHPQVAIFNGMGAKGVTLSPYFALEMVNFLEKGTELHPEANISRYFSLYFDRLQKS